MALGFTALRNETLKLLNETNTSIVGELSTGSGATGVNGANYIVESNSTILDYLNEAAKEIARSCAWDELTTTLTSASARLNPYASTLLWFPMLVSVSSTALIHCGEMELRNYNLSYQTTTGTPTHWYRVGANHIGLYPVPTTTISLSVTGGALPAAISYIGTSQTVTATVALTNSSIAATNTFVANQPVVFRTSTVSNIVAGTTYYVLATGLSGSAFQISATVNGAAITPTGGTAGSFTVDGFTGDSGTFSFIPDDLLLKALPAYAAMKLAFKNYDDPSLVGRAFWKDWYDQVRIELYGRLDASLRTAGGPYQIPPVGQSK